MKISYNWLQNHIEEKLPKPAELAETIIFHAFEVEDIEIKNDDTIMDIKVLPDRAHDCLSHHGIARELANLLKLSLKETTQYSLPETPLSTKIEIKSDLCKRYTAISMSNVSVGPSPVWLKEKLESLGQKSINNIVDIANFVLFDTGSPVHVFDVDKIDGGLVVRNAHPEESIITLTGESKILKEDMLVIADYVGALAIAGIKGGKTAEVDDNINNKTKNILIEVANFDPASIRKTAKALNLQTDASKRFENGITSEKTVDAIGMVVKMITEIAGGQVDGSYDHYENKEEQKSISFETKDLQRLLGDSITKEKIKEVFDGYHYKYENEGNNFKLLVPYERLDIIGTHDIAEEIGRVIGYDNIPSSNFNFENKGQNDETFENIRNVRAYLLNKGLREVMTYSFQKKGDIEVARGAKDKSALRTNLSETLKKSYDQNKLLAPLLGVEKIKIFEIGNIFLLKDKEIIEETRVATIEDDTIQEMSLVEFIKQNNIDNSSAIEYKQEVKPFKMWSLYPFITRDIAVWVENDEAKEKLLDLVGEFGKKYCVRDVVKFDEFTKDGRISIAFRFVFQSFGETLTNEDVEKTFSILRSQIEKDKDFVIR